MNKTTQDALETIAAISFRQGSNVTTYNFIYRMEYSVIFGNEFQHLTVGWMCLFLRKIAQENEQNEF